MENNEKIDRNMSITDIIMTMSEGNPDATNILTEMISDPKPRGCLNIVLLDQLDIRGSKLCMLWSDCSGKNIEKYYRTLMMLRGKTFTQEQIKGNLDLEYAIPFIDDSISQKGIPAYGENFGPSNLKWDEFCKIQKEAFVPKLEARIKQEQNHKRGSK